MHYNIIIKINTYENSVRRSLVSPIEQSPEKKRNPDRKECVVHYWIRSKCLCELLYFWQILTIACAKSHQVLLLSFYHLRANSTDGTQLINIHQLANSE